MAQNLIINGTVYNGVDSISMTNENNEKVNYVEKVNAGTGVPVAKIGAVEYFTVEDALAAAVPGETVTMIADSNEHTADLLVRGALVEGVESGVKLDLAGYKLTANSLTAGRGANVIDGSDQKTCLLIVPKGSLALRKENAQLPMWNEVDGYFFVSPTFANNQNMVEQTDSSFRATFRPGVGYRYENGTRVTVRTKYLTNGGKNNELSIKVRMATENTDGSGLEYYYYYTDANFAGGYSGQFSFTANNIGSSARAIFQVVLVSDTGVEMIGEPLTWTNPNA